jgi:hypothetical protein
MNNNSIRQSTYSSTTVIIILSILILAFIIVYLYNNYKDMKNKLMATDITKPIPMCPDYWDSIGNGKCQNTNSLGSCSKMPGANIMDFKSEVFTNKTSGDYAKCKWAKACNVSWSNVDKLC